MRVEILITEGCPNAGPAEAVARAALRELGIVDAELRVVEMREPADYARCAFGGSPTVLVNGSDVIPDTVRVHEPACRVYPSSDGLRGVPSLAEVVAALRG
ncbi:hypothetical protein [Leucobacter sp. M11]|uniref:hypothetical protein n=1 Tax=Leucobacter sp. M11 TaxID=2993565 RepID=UPI002D7E57ED|nr:hypothetical protein [Leucobacter sp. M11]MEB4616450.1 hypothetical protein [Leucobacter sp. M11]